MIKITVISYNHDAPAQPQFAVFGPAGGTVGRSDDNFFVLADPKRYVSRSQASIKSDGSRHTIVNLSQANPILVNGHEIAASGEHELKIGDEIQIGLYILGVESADSDTVPPAAKLDPRPVAPVASAAIDPLLLGSGSAMSSGQDPFADLLGNAVPVPNTPRHVVPAASASLSQSSSPQVLSPQDPFMDLLAGSSVTTSPVQTLQPAKPVVSPPPAMSNHDPFADLLGGLPASASAPPAASGPVVTPSTDIGRSNDPFADLLGARLVPVAPTPVKSMPAQFSSAQSQQGFDDLPSTSPHATALPERTGYLIPDDFDPFSMPSQGERNSIDPLADLATQSVSLESLDNGRKHLNDLMASVPATGADPLLDPLSLGVVPSSTVDPLALFGGDAIMSAPLDKHLNPGAVPNHVPEIDAQFDLPRPQQQMPATSTSPLPAAPLLPVTENMARPKAVPASIAQDVVSAPQIGNAAPLLQKTATLSTGFATAHTQLPPQSIAPGTQADADSLLKAFIKGANIPVDSVQSGLTPEFMETLGQLLSTVTQGTVELMASRALVKREVKADVTMIVVKNNNPLKFLPDGQTALVQMLGRKIPGFMGPVEAMQDAYEDLRAHQIGVVAGMRAALAEVLKRFNPELLEKRLKDRSFLDSVMPANRKAKMWDLYNDLFQEIYHEAQDDFQTLFGKAFVVAYEQEIERFKGEDKS